MKTETNATSKTIQIDGMHGDACVQKVTAALKHVPGVTTKSVSVGSAMVEADQAGCDAACAAINKAGYKSHLQSGDKGMDKSGQADGKSADGKNDQQRSGNNQNSGSKQGYGDNQGSGGNQGSGSNQGSGQGQKSNPDHANVGSGNKSVEPKTGNQSQPAKS